MQNDWNENALRLVFTVEVSRAQMMGLKQFLVSALRESQATQTPSSPQKATRASAGPTNVLLTTREAAQLLKMCEKSLWGMSRDGRMPPPTRLGRSVRWNAKHLSDWMDAGCPKVKDSI